MKPQDLEAGHSAELEISIRGEKMRIPTRVALVAPSTVLLDPVLLNGKPVGFPPQYQVNFYYPDDDRAYAWYGISVKPVKYGGRIYHSVGLAGDADVANRRSSCRIPLNEHMEVTIFSADGPNYINVLIKDISETGFAFLSDVVLDVRRRVRLSLRLGNSQKLHLSAEIVRKAADTTRHTTLYGCKFAERSRVLSDYLMSLQQQKQKEKMNSLLKSKRKK